MAQGSAESRGIAPLILIDIQLEGQMQTNCFKKDGRTLAVVRGLRVAVVSIWSGLLLALGVERKGERRGAEA